MNNFDAKFNKKSDRELIRIFISDPDSPDGRIAKEILEYRKFIVAKRQNCIMVGLTLVMAVATVVQVVTFFMR